MSVSSLPNKILLFYSPPESPSPSQALWDITVCFRKLQAQIPNPAIASRIQFQVRALVSR